MAFIGHFSSSKLSEPRNHHPAEFACHAGSNASYSDQTHRLPNSLTMFSTAFSVYPRSFHDESSVGASGVTEQPTENGWLLCFHGHFYLPNKF